MAITPVGAGGSQAALLAYRAIDGGALEGAGGAAAASPGGGFSGALNRALGAVVDTARQAETGAMQAISGQGDIGAVVTAVAKAELALQTTAAVRDRVVQAYQDIMRMPI
jgi:flagellar hook-basal body complex protein FliE